MSQCIALMTEAMQAASDCRIAVPQRLIAPLIDSSGFITLMPGSTLQPRIYGAKVIGVHPTNPDRGLPGHQGFVALFDHDTGTPVAIIDGTQVTTTRTAAASALATRTLARPDAKTHGVFGAGMQAEAHVEAINAVRAIERVTIWARVQAKAESLAEKLRELHSCQIRVTTDPSEAAACDVVTTVTGAHEPVVRGEWLKPGAHLNLVGAHSPKTREIDDEVVRRSTIYVDLMRSALNEAGDLLIPMQSGVICARDIVGEIGQVLAGTVAGRKHAAQITLYKSLGIFAQDLIAAAHVYQVACKQNVGSSVEM